ncbi:MAG TPA: hypothetical protein VFP13_05735, partial [Actinomycetota bacterium]|nr:hypothetical protein [Actinomycetota bacterium]
PSEDDGTLAVLDDLDRAEHAELHGPTVARALAEGKPQVTVGSNAHGDEHAGHRWKNPGSIAWSGVVVLLLAGLSILSMSLGSPGLAVLAGSYGIAGSLTLVATSMRA